MVDIYFHSCVINHVPTKACAILQTALWSNGKRLNTVISINCDSGKANLAEAFVRAKISLLSQWNVTEIYFDANICWYSCKCVYFTPIIIIIIAVISIASNAAMNIVTKSHITCHQIAIFYAYFSATLKNAASCSNLCFSFFNSSDDKNHKLLHANLKFMTEKVPCENAESDEYHRDEKRWSSVGFRFVVFFTHYVNSILIG